MAISFQLDADLEQQLRRDFGDLDAGAKETLLIEAYRLGKLSIGRLAQTTVTATIRACVGRM